MALEIKPKLLRELRLRVLVYDRIHTPDAHDRLLAAARAVAASYAKAHEETTERQVRRRRRQAEERISKGLCRFCGKAPHRPDRVSCAPCGQRQCGYARRQREAPKW